MDGAVKDTQTTDEIDVENAVSEAGFGKFNIKVAILCGLIYMNTGFGISTVSFILPSAACDLQLSTLDKGRITATPILGMAAGSYFWGCFAEVQGRRLTLLFALFSYTFMEILSALLSTYYWLFLLLKFLSGWAISGQTAVVFTYLGEFQSNEFRDRILSWMEMAWTVGLIALPLVGWAVIPIEFAYVTDYFAFRSWNCFIIVCALPSLLIGLWLLWFPESPKHLAETKQDYKLSRVLETMYFQNTGGYFNEYLDNLSKKGYDRLRLRLMTARPIADPTILGMTNTINNDKAPEAASQSKSQLFWKILLTLCSQTIRLWKPPYFQRTFIASCLYYFIGSSYFGLMLWFPEVFHRFGVFEKNQPDETTSVCKVSSINRTIIIESELDWTSNCPNKVQSEVYIQTIILGFACLPVSIILPLLVDKLGYKFFLVFSCIAASSVTIGLFFVKSALQNLILSSIFEAFSSISLSIILSLVVDLFPTDLRVMAAALSIFFGRLGALTGNTLVGYLIDDYCITLISIIAAQLILATFLGLLIPGKPKSYMSSTNPVEKFSASWDT